MSERNGGSGCSNEVAGNNCSPTLLTHPINSLLHSHNTLSPPFPPPPTRLPFPPPPLPGQRMGKRFSRSQNQTQHHHRRSQITSRGTWLFDCYGLTFGERQSSFRWPPCTSFLIYPLSLTMSICIIPLHHSFPLMDHCRGTILVGTTTKRKATWWMANQTPYDRATRRRITTTSCTNGRIGEWGKSTCRGGRTRYLTDAHSSIWLAPILIFDWVSQIFDWRPYYYLTGSYYIWLALKPLPLLP